MRSPRLGLVLLLLAALPLLLRGAEEISRIEQLREQIRDTESLLAQATRTNEKTSLQTRLDRLRRELDNQEQRIRLEERERDLARALVATPENALREMIRSVDRSAENLEEQRMRVEAELRKLQTERDTLVLQRAQTRGTDERSLALASELDERINATREGVAALNLEHDALAHELRLTQEVDRIEERLRVAAVPSRVRFSALLETRSALEHDEDQTRAADAGLAALRDTRGVNAARLELNRQKLAQIDDEIALLEKQTGIFNSNRESVRALNIARSQKKYLGQELNYSERQLAAIDRSIIAMSRLRDLSEKEAAWLATVFSSLRTKYLERLLTPVLLIAAFVGLYFVLSRAIFPRLKHRENLMLMRRFARYVGVLASAVVIVAFLFEDMQGFLTVIGIVSAGLVIALQDVCASIAGWCAIMTGGKFRVGDRIEVEGARGDVIDIDLLRTTILEVRDELGVEHPTGRVIALPNSFVLRGKVGNASHGHPYVWCREVFTFTYESSWANAEALVRRVVEEETAQNFDEARRAAARMEKRYGVADAEYQSKIFVRLADSGYEYSCLHVCHVRKIDDTKSRIHRRLAAELDHDQRLQLAYPTQRELGGDYVPPPKEVSTGPAVSAVATVPVGTRATVTVTESAAVRRSGNGMTGRS